MEVPIQSSVPLELSRRIKDYVRKLEEENDSLLVTASERVTAVVQPDAVAKATAEWQNLRARSKKIMSSNLIHILVARGLEAMERGDLKVTDVLELFEHDQLSVRGRPNGDR